MAVMKIATKVKVRNVNESDYIKFRIDL